MTPDIDIIRRRAHTLVELAQEWGYVVTLETKPEQPLAMGNHFMAVDVRPARELDQATIDIIEARTRALAELDEDEWTCSLCGGPMYRQPHWHYGQCDDCGRREDLEPMEP